jgi:hypothetical protein
VSAGDDAALRGLPEHLGEPHHRHGAERDDVGQDLARADGWFTSGISFLDRILFRSEFHPDPSCATETIVGADRAACSSEMSKRRSPAGDGCARRADLEIRISRAADVRNEFPCLHEPCQA